MPNNIKNNSCVGNLKTITDMRTKEEVLKELRLKRKEQKRIDKLISKEDWSEGGLGYLMSRLQNLSFSIYWCKWFLNVDTK